MPPEPARADLPLLVAIDGPSGSGKTTTARHLSTLLTAEGTRVLSVAHPSDSPLGQLTRTRTLRLRGPALSCLVAADRYHHTATVIAPALEEGRTVVCDRYLASALVLDRMDGAEIDFVESLYRYLRRPDLQVLLTAPHRVRVRRVKRRGPTSRFHPLDEAAALRETRLFAEAARSLRRTGQRVLALDSTHGPEQVTRRIAEALHTPKREEVPR